MDPLLDFLWTAEGRLVAAAALLQAVLLVLLVRRWRRERRAAKEPEAAPPPSGVEELEPSSEPVPRVGVPPVAEPPRVAPGRLRDALAKSREIFRARVDAALGGREIERLLPDLEEALVSADVGIATAGRILERLRSRLDRSALDSRTVRRALRSALEEVVGEEPDPVREPRPWVILVAGVNGVGKTTTIGKLAARFRAEGKKVLVAAADTFRAAATEQLGIWAERVGADFVRHQAGADPGAVAFDAVHAAMAREVDVVLVDTAGRLHTRQNLMEELRKVARVTGKALPGAPHEVLLVLDATTGQNALRQARVFSEALGVTGIVLTKLDGTAKGGAALAVRDELGVPIRYVGVGERLEDLRPFSAAEFARDLLDDGEDSDLAETTPPAPV